MIFPPLLTNQKTLEDRLKQLGIRDSTRMVYARPWNDSTTTAGALFIGPSIWFLTACFNRPSFIVFEENQIAVVRTFAVHTHVTRFDRHRLTDFSLAPVAAAKSNDNGVGYQLTFTSMGRTYSYFVLSQYKLPKNQYLTLKLTQTIKFVQTWKINLISAFASTGV
ncbi:hypothetical protein [Lacticaseibacillus absianus]|uniref:hypothetical protein n=1 Tax=Lacticaseibacillus absianus TaxID=2729623 RepID=UPI0015CDB55F|nr:hypothetical protein [Lacticaseibacillus absianus]